VKLPVRRKIVSPQALVAALQEVRRRGGKVVQCHGCFDIVHPGHIRYLQFARQLGDVLVVSLTGDAAVNKGPDRPYIPEELRAENLAALELVDWVVIDPHPTACEILQLVRPDIYVKGCEYAQSADQRFLGERKVVESYGGRVAFHSGDVLFSSTRLLEAAGTDRRLEEYRLRTLCWRNGLQIGVLRRIVEGFAGARALVVGDLIRERSVLCDMVTACDDGPALSAQRVGATEWWGGAAALALQLKALGATPRLVAATARDADVADLAGQLDRLGLTCNLLAERSRPVERSTFMADERPVFRLVDGACTPLDSVAEKRSSAVLASELRQADLLLWCDHGFGMITPGLVAAGGAAARARRVFVAGCAIGPRARMVDLTGTHLLSGTERQVRQAMHELRSGLPAVVSDLLYRTHGQTAVVSLRGRGLLGFDRRSPAGGDSLQGAEAGGEVAGGWRPRLRSEFVPSVARHWLNPVGAEEAVLATAALALAGGNSLAAALYLAAAAEALVVGQPDHVAPDAAALLVFLDRRPELQAAGQSLGGAADRPESCETVACLLNA